MALRVVFVGDVTQRGRLPDVADALPLFARADCVIANLEGPILPDGRLSNDARVPLLPVWSDLSALELFQGMRVKAVSLANNHVHDIEGGAEETERLLAGAGIETFGAGATEADAVRPFTFQKDDLRLLVIGFGWPVIGCRPVRRGRHGVNPLDAASALEAIREIRRHDSESVVVFVMHWNYELEAYPQPAHRQLALCLIEAGVDAVVGGHSHRVEGFETARGRIVAYGLGNWITAELAGELLSVTYPEASSTQVALALTITGRRAIEVQAHWFGRDPGANRIRSLGVEEGTGPTFAARTPFAGTNHEEYVRWFRAHRLRRRLLPVYADYRTVKLNRVRDRYVAARHKIITALVRLGLKNTLSGGVN